MAPTAARKNRASAPDGQGPSVYLIDSKGNGIEPKGALAS